MKKTTNFLKAFKAPLMAGLLATLAMSASAQSREDDHWSPLDTFTDGNGNNYAYWDDANNWSLAVVPTVLDSNQVNTYFNAAFDDNASAPVYCIVTNTTQVTAVGQLMAGFGGGGTLVISNNAHFQAGFAYGGNWTGIGFVAGPGTLIVEPGADFTCASHLWVGQGTADVGTVLINGGTLHIPNGQLGVSWNGIGGTNYITITNGGALYLSQWAAQTLGAPGSGAANYGVMDIEVGSKVVITNNATGYFNTLITNNQLIALSGKGQIQSDYNPTLNITTITALAPPGPPTPKFSASPTNEIVSLHGTATLTAAATPATGYQWLYNSVPLTDGNGISGSTTATLTIANFGVANTGLYSVIATNSADPGTTYRNYNQSAAVSVTAESFNLYPVITINGVNGNTYVVQYTTSLTSPVTWTSFATNTVGAGPAYIVDTATPASIQRFYRVIQQ